MLKMSDFDQFMNRASVHFDRAIQKARPSSDAVNNLVWVYQPYDRCTTRVGALAELGPDRAGLILVESHSKGLRRPYHKKKLALVLSSGRHFALEAASRGYRVIHVRDQRSFGSGLLEAQQSHRLKEIVSTKPAERELRLDLEDAAGRGLRLTFKDDCTWLSTEGDFTSAYEMTAGKRPKSFVMDRFYRYIRNKSGILMLSPGKPAGGRFSFDFENRRPYRGQIEVPKRPSYRPDAITKEVLAFVKALPAKETIGNIDDFDWPCAESDVLDFWQFCLKQLLPHFGPFEDAMSAEEPALFHSKISALVNLSRLLPGRVIRDTVEEYDRGRIALPSAEGFVRQILGWREYMRHLHRVTDGYRDLDVFYESRSGHSGAAPSALHATLPLPAAYWGVESGLRCLDAVVKQVLEEGWSHHITRLMVLSNLATLCGFSPRELCDWFWFAYVDAYEWVVESNVLGMSTYADGGVTATKPYVSGAAYVNRMSDYCHQCQYNPKKTLGPGACPFNALYWTFLERNQEYLSSNSRMKLPYVLLSKKSAEERKLMRQQAQQAIDALENAPHNYE